MPEEDSNIKTALAEESGNLVVSPSGSSSGKEGGDKQASRSSNKSRDPVECSPPDQASFDENFRNIQQQIDTHQTEVESRSASIEQLQAQRDIHRTAVRQFSESLDGFKGKRAAIQATAEEARKQLQEIDSRRDEKRTQLNQFKAQLKFTNLQDLSLAVGKINFKLQTTPRGTMPIELEQKLIRDIKMLNDQRQAVVNYSQLVAEAVASKVDTTVLRATRDDSGKQIKALRQEEQALYKKLTESRKASRKVNDKIEILVQERKEHLDARRKLRGKLSKLTSAYERQQRKFKRWKDFLDYQKRVKVREERAARRQAEAESSGTSPEADDIQEDADEKVVIERHPYQLELDTIGELVRYLESLAPELSKSSMPDGNKLAEQQKLLSEEVQKRAKKFTGAKKVSEFKPRVEESWGGVENVVEKKAPKKKPKKAALLPHIPDIFSRFEKIGVNPPRMTSDVETALRDLNERLEHFSNAPSPEEVRKQKEEEARQVAMEKEKKEKEEEANREKAAAAEALRKKEAEKAAAAKAEAEKAAAAKAEAEKAAKAEEAAPKAGLALKKKAEAVEKLEVTEVEDPQKQERTKSAPEATAILDDERAKKPVPADEDDVPGDEGDSEWGEGDEGDYYWEGDSDLEEGEIKSNNRVALNKIE